MNGIIKTVNGFAVKDFNEGKIIRNLENLSFPSYEIAVKACCGEFYPPSYYQYLIKVYELRESGKLTKDPDADIWENLIYAGDYRGVWNGTEEKYCNVTSMDKGAATEDEIAYVDALASTYESLEAMAK